VGAYVAAQCDALISNDIGLRTGAPVMHQTRVAARRLRSTLRVFGDVVDAAAADELNNELAWYADVLGQVGDREVLNTRLTNLITDLPPQHVRGPVEAEITKTLAKERDDAIQRLNAAMRTRRVDGRSHRHSPIIGFAAAMLLSWLALVIALAIRRPKGDLLTESPRLLADLLRLLRRLTTNRNLRGGTSGGLARERRSVRRPATGLLSAAPR